MKKKWSSQMIQEEILQISDIVGSRMPTAGEMRLHGKNDLACVISRRGGFRKWAKSLGLGLKSCETMTGMRWEDYVLGVLLSNGMDADPQSCRAPFDILVNGSIRMNVKSAKWSEYGPCKGHFFGIGDTWKKCDVFALVKVLRDPNPDVLWVPSGEAQQQTVTITKSHRLNEFKDMNILISKSLTLL